MTFFKVEIALKKQFFDAIGESIRKSIISDLNFNLIERISFVDVFFFDFPLSEEKLKELIESIFIDPIINFYSINCNAFNDFDFSVTIKLKEGITDNIAIVALNSLKDFGLILPENAVKSARKYYFKGKLKKEDIKFISEKLLFNPLIELAEIEELK